MRHHIKKIQKFALASTIATYLLIFIGGLVRVSGAGLGCPDWPRCFGGWFPPLNRADIPAGFDADSFNFVLAWIEYINRLAGMITGFLILITAILAIRYFRNKKQLLVPAVSAAILVAIQGWFGSVVVKSQLMPLTVSIHLVLALLIVSLLLYLTFRAYHPDRAPAVPGKQLKTRRLLSGLWIVTLIQVVFGAETRSAIEGVLRESPLLLENQVLGAIGFIGDLHGIWGMILTILSLFIILRIFGLPDRTVLTGRLTGVLAGLIILQLVVGLAMQSAGVFPLLQVFHLWLASLFIGNLLLMYSELSYEQKL